jgi:polysaccharide pyruvyl transferase WcaK-like protein
MKDLPGKSEITSHRSVVRVWAQPEDLPAWIQEYGLVVGMRYHALALAALAEKPFIGWGFQRKVRTLCRDFSQPMWTFERGWDPEAMYRQVCEAWRGRDALPDRYRAQIKHLIDSPAEASESARIFVASA